MRQVGVGMILGLSFAALSGCGTNSATPDAQGSVHVSLQGMQIVDSSNSGSMASIVVKNIFDESLQYLVQCTEKDHTNDGKAFCDELIVVPPGTYEIIVQPGDANCETEYKWYKAIVNEGETTEIAITVVCGETIGGLDVIVEKEYKPSVADISFNFEGNGIANKFICNDSPDDTEPKDVVITIAVSDEDTSCAALAAEWESTPDGLQSPGPVEFTGDATGTVNPESGECEFKAVVDAAASTVLPDDGYYTVTFTVTDGTHETVMEFPVHVVDCYPPPSL